MEILPSRFTTYILTEEEELRGCILSLEQQWMLQNKMSEAALAKSALKLDPNNTLPFVQQESFLAGQVELCEFFLDNSEAATIALTSLTMGTNDNEE